MAQKITAHSSERCKSLLQQRPIFADGLKSDFLHQNRFQQTLATARRQSAKSLELQAVMSRSRRWQHQGKREEAHQMLVEIYGWLTEGFETKDLQEAGVLLQALASQSKVTQSCEKGGKAMIRGIHHTAISTGDLERSLRFYRDLLGFEEVFSSAWEVGTEVADRITGLQDSSARLAMLKAGNACIELFQYARPKPKPGEPKRPVCDHGITHICLDVTDIEAEYERLKAAGMPFHCPPQEVGGGVRATYGRDPDGNVVELLEVRDTKSPMALKVE